MSELSARARAFRSAIVAFIEARRDAKLKGQDDGGAAASKYEPDAWLLSKAESAKKVNAATHIPKATHPDAKGAALYVSPEEMAQLQEVSSSCLGVGYAEDFVCDAKYLDVVSLLTGVEVEGQLLWYWVRRGDVDLVSSLHTDESTAREIWSALSAIGCQNGAPKSDVVAKQVYWLVGEDPADDAGYHLLQPMFSSSLAHAVHAYIQDARFSDEAKAARDARWKKLPHAAGFAEYKGLAVRKLGGSKPQNISHLNRERRGINYLLESLPPRWRDLGGFLMFGRASAIECVSWLEEVRTLKRHLIELLRSDPDPTMETRLARGAIERALGEQLPVFAASVQARHEPGWTRSPECELPLCEQLWLDPERVELKPRDDFLADDLAFNAAFASGTWADQVAERFGHWVNGWLRAAGITTVGDAELRHWARQALVEVAWPTPLQRRVSGEVA